MQDSWGEIVSFLDTKIQLEKINQETQTFIRPEIEVSNFKANLNLS